MAGIGRLQVMDGYSTDGDLWDGRVKDQVKTISLWPNARSYDEDSGHHHGISSLSPQ